MSDDNLKNEINLQLSAGHLLVVWDVLANRLADSSFMKELPEDEQRSLWALQDICEEKLAENGFSARPQDEWGQLMELAREQVRSIPIEFLG